MDNNPFWNFSLKAYDNLEFATACLSLQNDHGADVNCLLLALWLAEQGVDASKEEWEQLENTARDIRTEVIRPVRDVRSQMKNKGLPTLYEALKIAELAAEKAEQDLLWAAVKDKASNGPRPENDIFKLLAMNNLYNYLNEDAYDGAQCLLTYYSQYRMDIEL